MKRVRQNATKPEMTVRGCVTRMGRRFRLCNRDLPGSPDLANRAGKWVILVHGCYWHRHKNCARSTTPSRNSEFWKAKFRANMARDARVVRALRAIGFRVLTIWECQTEAPARLENIVRRFLDRPRAGSDRC